MLPPLLDVIVPTVGYYVLHALGLGDFWALTLAGAVTAVWAIAATIRRRRFDGVALLVVIELILSAILIFATRDARIVLLKPSFFTAAAGIYLLATCVIRRPLTVETSRPFATGGDPAHEQAAEAAWADSPAYRRLHQQLTAFWGLIWICESVIRGVVVLHTDVVTGVWASQLPGIAALIACLVYTRLHVPSLKTHIQQHLPESV